MGIMARLLGWVWRRWADYNLVVALLDILDWKTGLSALIGGLLMTFFGATNTGWSAQGVVLAALIAAACCALVFIALRLFFCPRSEGLRNAPKAAPLISQDEGIGDDPDWPIAELFSYIDPNVIDQNREGDLWDEIGNDIRDKFSLGKLPVWGRPVDQGLGKLFGERQVLRQIEQAYWGSAYFTYSFLAGAAEGEPHTYLTSNSDLPTYTDLRVNRARAMALWPRPEVPRGLSVENGRLRQNPMPPEGAADGKAFPDGLNVSKIWFQRSDDPESRGMLYINVDAFNGTGEPILMQSVGGRIRVKFQDSPASTPVDIMQLPPPHFYKARQNKFEAFDPFSFILEQPIPANLIEKFDNWTTQDRVVFDFDKLEVMIQSASNPKNVARLPLWDQAQLMKQGAGILATQISVLWGDRPWKIRTSQ